MKRTYFLLITVFIATILFAQAKQEEHLLEGTSMDVYYENGYGFHYEFKDGQIIFIQIAGPSPGGTGQEIYKSKKIADKIYVVNFLVTSKHSFCTFIFNFNQNILVASAIRINDEANFLDSATIEHLHLKEK